MERRSSRITGKMLLLILAMTSYIILGTGCASESLMQFVETDLKDMITHRINANEQSALALYNAGLMSESELNIIVKTLQDRHAEILSANEGNSKESQLAMFRSISTWRRLSHSIGISLGYEDKNEWDMHIVTNAVEELGKDVPGYDNIHVIHGNKTVVPISIIDDKTGADINARFGFPIYVLKSATDLGGEENEVALDELSEVINKALEDPNDVILSELDKYFHIAKDEANNNITLLDTSLRENKVVVTSDGASESMVEHPDSESTPNKVLASQKGLEEFSGSTYTNEPGKDMIVSQEGYDILSMRFTEFNNEAIEKIIKTLGLADDKYLVVPDKGGGRVYLLEYPVHNISKFVEVDDKSYESEFEQSNMGINLKTGDLVKYSGAWDTTEDGMALGGITTIKEDPYLTMRGAKNNLDTSKASFSLLGDMDMEVGYKNDEIKVGRIILKDYLEGTYAPGVVSDENMVVFGRKIRIENLKGLKSDAVANFYDKAGNKIEIGGKLYINDFADIESLVSGSPEVRYIRGEYESDLETEGTETEEEREDGVQMYTVDNGGTGGNGSLDDFLDDDDGELDHEITTEELIQDAIKKIDGLPKKTVDEIETSLPFPGRYIGKIDHKESETPIFYTMAIRKSMFDTGLFSGWIYDTESETNSLNWWNTWLHDHQYQYQIDKTILEEYLIGNYSYELGKQGILVLDLETISKIQEQYEQEDIITKNRKNKTIYLLLGAILIGYSGLMLLAWVVDTNVDIGLSLLEKMTLGHFIAVSDESEVAFMDTEGRRYIGFGSLVGKSLIIASVGMIVILVDVIELVYWVIQIFGGISKFISKIITGL